MVNRGQVEGGEVVVRRGETDKGAQLRAAGASSCVNSSAGSYSTSSGGFSSVIATALIGFICFCKPSAGVPCVCSELCKLCLQVTIRLF